jgi:3-methyladenine DNA glycosylase AlkD
VRRGAFALLASLCAHDKQADDAKFLHGLSLVEAAAEDERNFVAKGVSWALRSVGKKNRVLHQAAVALARRLAERAAATPRWIGKEALRDLARTKRVK